MTHKKTNQTDLVERFRDALNALDGGEVDELSSSEIERLRGVLAFLDKLAALKWFGRWAFYFVAAAGTVIVNWERIKIFFTGDPQ